MLLILRFPHPNILRSGGEKKPYISFPRYKIKFEHRSEAKARLKSEAKTPAWMV